MQSDDFDTLAARADLVRLLAACFYQPGPEFEQERLFASLAQAAAPVDPDLGATAGRLGEAFAAEDLEDLLIEYTRLFLGPVDTVAQPYGSVWLEPSPGLMQDSTQAVVALYAEGGFELAEDFRDLPDHVSAELEFLYLLLFRRAEALRSGDTAAGEFASRLQRRLLDEHLGRWVPRFAAAVRAGSRSAFYRELAELMDAVTRFEAAASGAREPATPSAN